MKKTCISQRFFCVLYFKRLQRSFTLFPTLLVVFPKQTPADFMFLKHPRRSVAVSPNNLPLRAARLRNHKNYTLNFSLRFRRCSYWFTAGLNWVLFCVKTERGWLLDHLAAQLPDAATSSRSSSRSLPLVAIRWYY